MDYKDKLKKIASLASELVKYEGVSLGRGVKTESNIFFDTENGPIVIGEDCIIRAGAVLRGPLLVGRSCRLGGEIEHSIIGDYTNKQHYGYVGHSYIGNWVNLGAGTSISDLKNTYSAIKMKGIDTGEIKLGVIIGDYSKTAINTSIFCGKVIGTSSHLYGTVTEDVPAFVSHVSPGNMYELPLKLAKKIQKAMMARRGLEFTEKDEELFDELFEKTKGERKKAGVKKEKLSFK